MFKVDYLEFPFVQEMPKREKSKVRKVWEHFQELSRLSQEKGMLVPQNFVASLLGVCKQRVDQLCDEEPPRLERIYVDGHAFITERSVLDFAVIERKNGRPVKMAGLDLSEGKRLPGKVESARAAVKLAREIITGRKGAK